MCLEFRRGRKREIDTSSTRTVELKSTHICTTVNPYKCIVILNILVQKHKTKRFLPSYLRKYSPRGPNIATVWWHFIRIIKKTNFGKTCIYNYFKMWIRWWNPPEFVFREPILYEIIFVFQHHEYWHHSTPLREGSCYQMGWIFEKFQTAFNPSP